MQPFKSLFWDVDWSKVDRLKHKKYIIERILEMGDQEAVEWLFSIYRRGEIEAVLKTTRNISPKSKNYWFLVLNAR